MDSKQLWSAIRKHWIIVAVAAVLGVAGGVLMVLQSTPKYASSVAFFVSTPSTDDASALAADQFATRRVNSYVRLASSEKLAEMVISDTGLTMSPVSVSKAVSASADLNTVLLTVRVVDPVADRSLKIATSVSRQLPDLIGTIDTSGSKAQAVRLTVVSGPRLVPGVIRPSRVLTVGIGLLAGLLIGIVIAYLRQLMDSTIRSRDVLAAVTDAPVLGIIGFDSAAEAEPLLVGRQARSVRAEAFRQLRTNLQFMDVDDPTRVIVVTSSIAMEGKSTTSANLAMVFAETGLKTLLIEADMRRPKLTEYLGLERSVGLSNVLVGQVQVEEVLQPWGDGTLMVLAGGTVPPNPSEMLGSQGMTSLMERLRARFDLIIIDTPPLLPVTDAAVASLHADGVLMVVRHGRTTRAQVSSAIASLRAVDASIFGTVLNMARSRSAKRDGYDGYGYYEDRLPVAQRSASAVTVADNPAEMVEGRRQRWWRLRRRTSDRDGSGSPLTGGLKPEPAPSADTRVGGGNEMLVVGSRRDGGRTNDG